MQRRLVLLLVLCFMPITAHAANHYVRDGGSGDGSDWTNACDDFAGSCAVASMVRGDTYYVADGSYASRTFNRATSGTSVITIKKATAADHGTDTGWNSAYGDGQATFAAPIAFTTSYWTFDGSTRDESNPPLSWFTSSAYGFAVSNNGNTARRQVEMYTSVDFITMKYFWCQGKTGSFVSGERRYCVDVEDNENNRHEDLLFSHNLYTDSNQHLFLRTTERAIAEYSAHDNLGGDGDTNHGNVINLYWHAENAIVRFNVFRNIGQYTGYSGVTQVIAIAERNDGGNGVRPTYWAYGNLTFRTSGADGVFGYGTTSSTSNADCLNCREFNNTIVDGNMQYNNPWGFQHQTGSGNIAQNNLFMDTPNSSLTSTAQSSLGSGGTLSYNAYGTGGSGGGTNVQNNVPTSIFVNFAGDDYRLASATSCGTTLSGTAPDGGRLDIDMLGNIRGADGCWDRGAFEYCVGGCAASETPRFSPSLNLRRAQNELAYADER